MGQPIDTATVLLVSDASGFARQIKLQVDEALRGVAAQVDRAFSAIERSSQSTGTEIGQDFQRGGERAELAFGELSRTAKREFAEIDVAASASAAGMSSKLGGALAVLKTGLLTAGAAAGVGLIAMTGFGLKSAASIEQVTIGLQALTGSAETAKTFLVELQNFAATTPFEFAGVADASRRILAFGTSVGIAREQVIPTLTTIGDLVSVLGGTQESIDSVIRAFGQMASKGKVSQEEILQLAEALPGFNVNAAIAASQGKSVADTLTLITAGGVDAKTGIDAILKGMAAFPGAAGAMALQAQTLTGVFSTFKDTVSIALTNAFAPAIPAIKDALSELTPILGSAIGQLAPSLGAGLAAILPLLGKLISAIVPILAPILDALGPVLDALGPALQPLGEALGQLVVALVPILPVVAQFIAVLAELAIPIIKLLAAVLVPLTPILNYMALAIGEVAKALGMIDWTAVGSAIGGAFADAWHAVSDFFTQAIEGWRLFGVMVLNKIIEFKNNVVANFNAVVQFVKDLPGNIISAAANFVNVLFDAGKNLIVGLWNGISNMGGWLWGQITGFINRFLTGPIKAALGIHSPSTVMRDEVGAMVPAGIMEGVQAGLPNLASLIGGIVPSANASGGGAGTTIAGGISVTINFVGGTPTVAEANKVGQAAGDGIMQAIARRNVATAVRMGVSG